MFSRSIFRPQFHPTLGGSPYKNRTSFINTISGMNSNNGGAGGALNLGPSHLLQSSQGGPSTEPVTPPPPTMQHSMQRARTHPYATAAEYLPTPLPLGCDPVRGFPDQPSITGGLQASPFHLRPIQSESRRGRITMLPHSDYSGGGGPPVLSGPGPGGGGGGNSGGSSGGRQTLYPIHTLLSGTHNASAPQVSVDGYHTEAGGEGSVHKKMRITGSEPLLMKATVAQPPRIDARPVISVAPGVAAAPVAPVARSTREQSAYIPQVEAISPTPDSPLRSTKDDLLQQITKAIP